MVELKNAYSKLVVKNMKLDNEYLEIMANGWLLYQTIVCRLFARSGFYQSGGAIGYRDQLQDTLALISTWPERTRQQIVLHSSKQFEKGDVLHWWHEHSGAGIRTYFSDDYLWLPYVLSEYVTRTGDISVLDEKVQVDNISNFVIFQTEDTTVLEKLNKNKYLAIIIAVLIIISSINVFTSFPIASCMSSPNI